MHHPLIFCSPSLHSGALEKLDISDNAICAEGGKALAEALKNNQILSELNVASNYLAEDQEDNRDMSGVIAISSAIPTMGAMTNLNVSANQIPTEEMKKIITIAESKPTMKTLCKVPFKDKTTTELDLSGKNLGVDGAMVVSHYIQDNGALTSLDLSNNSLGGYHVGYQWISDMSGVTALAAAIPECR